MVRNFSYSAGRPRLHVRNLQRHLDIYGDSVLNAQILAGKMVLDRSGEIDAEIICQHRQESNSILLHELYFEALTAAGGSCGGSLFEEVANLNFPGLPAWKNNFSEAALNRGIGRIVTFYGRETGQLLNQRICGDKLKAEFLKFKPVLVLAMWEHACILDYPPNECLKYTGSFLQNIDWAVIDNRLKEAETR